MNEFEKKKHRILTFLFLTKRTLNCLVSKFRNSEKRDQVFAVHRLECSKNFTVVI